MKRNLAFLFVAVASAALAQTPTVVEKPAVKTPASQTQATAKTSAKTPAQSPKPSAATVKVVPVAAAKPVVVAAKPVAVPAHPATVKAVAVPAAKPNAAPPAKPVAVVVSGKPVAVAAPAVHGAVVVAKPVPAASAPKVMAVAVKTAPAKSDPFKSSTAQKAPVKTTGQPVAVATAPAVSVQKQTNSAPPAPVAVQDNKPAGDNKPAEPVHAANRRDPFVSPVVNMGATGSGCSSGKRCLAIDQVALKGVVKSDGGMIAVVVNALDKAYFLRENDPVFNGYVLKITVDSIVFKETFHDKLGKPLTRDVTKSITAPAV
jgi:hypothetical protein